MLSLLKSVSSDNALLVILKLHDEWLDILALSLPFADALLSVGVEVLLLLVEESLSLDGVSLLSLEVFDCLILLGVVLCPHESGQLLGSLSFFFLFLLLGQLKLFVADSPELSEVFLFLLLCNALLLLACDLEGSAALDGLLHLNFSLLLHLEESVSLILSFSDLSVQNLLLVVLESSQFFNLTVNHALSLGLLGLEALVLTLLLHFIAGISGLGKVMDLLLFFGLLKKDSLLLLELVLVCFAKVGSDLGTLLLSGDFLLLLPLEIFFDLSLDKFTFEQLFLDLFDVAQFEGLKLVADVL